MPRAIRRRGKSALLQDEPRVLKIAAKTDVYFGFRHAEISIYPPRERQVVPTANGVGSGDGEFPFPFARMLDQEVFIDSRGDRRAARVIPWNRHPGFEVLGNRERMEETADIRANTDFHEQR